MKSPFESLIQELGQELEITLHVDENNACALRVNELFTVQLQEDHSENLLIACLVIELPPGRFRQNVFIEALKANAESPQIGTFGFLPVKNALTLHHTTPLSLLKGTSLAVLTSEFIQVAELWHTNIRDGRAGPPSKSRPFK